LGAKYLVVLCAGSALLLVEDALIRIVNGALVGSHSASKHHLLEFGFFLDTINLGFLLRENLLLYSSCLPLGVPNGMLIYINTTTASNR
jgi:hypothetical protein